VRGTFQEEEVHVCRVVPLHRFHPSFDLRGRGGNVGGMQLLYSCDSRSRHSFDLRLRTGGLTMGGGSPRGKSRSIEPPADGQRHHERESQQIAQGEGFLHFSRVA
jgi:hypothetical protein